MNVSSALAALIAASLAVAQDPAPKPAPKPQDEAPKVLGLGDELPKDITLQDLDGKLHTFADLRGKVVVLHFWSSTCPWEIVAEPKINALAADYAKKDVVVLGIAANAGEIGKKPEPEEFREKDADKRPYAKLRAKAIESEVNHPILADHGARVGKLLDAKTTPHMFVFDAKGKMVYTGALDDDGRGKQPERAANYVRAAIDATLAGEAVGMATTKPYG